MSCLGRNEEEEESKFHIHPYPRKFRKKSFNGYRLCKTFYFGLKLKEEFKNDRRIIDLKPRVLNFFRWNNNNIVNKHYKLKDTTNLYILMLSKKEIPNEVLDLKPQK